jgi:hypothetical protein
MSAHSAGAPSWSQRRREHLRQAEIERQREQQHAHEVYLEQLATKLMRECGISQATALRRVRALSISANPQRRDDRAVRFG